MMEYLDLYKRLFEYQTNEKVIIRDQKSSYLINKALAIAISPDYYRELKNNPTLKTLDLSIEGNIEEFINSLINKTKIAPEIFLKVSVPLNNICFIEKWKKENEVTKDNAIELLMKLDKYKCKIENMVEEIEVIGKNIEELIDRKEFEEIPSIYISEISKRVEGAKSEEKIFKYIMKRLKEERDEKIRKQLIKSIEKRGLNNKNINELIDNIKYDEITEGILSKVQNGIESIEKENLENQRERIKVEKKMKEKEEKLQRNQNEKFKIEEERRKVEKALKEKEEEIQKNQNEKFKIEEERRKVEKALKEKEEEIQRNQIAQSTLENELKENISKSNAKIFEKVLTLTRADIKAKDINYQNMRILFLINII